MALAALFGVTGRLFLWHRKAAWLLLGAQSLVALSFALVTRDGVMLGCSAVLLGALHSTSGRRYFGAPASGLRPARADSYLG